ncbi:MAG: VCBS repeat-containing protein, partial [Planctomycetes bacterium]|nr:VCBS repeat-containing protein [Planctomycetota bacterium]
LPDLVLVPGATAPAGSRPQVLLARPTGAGAPGFAAPVELIVRTFPYEAFEVADLDGDGALDIALASGTQGKLDVAYGLGDGTFTAGVPLDFTVPGYALDVDSRAVGLHACRDATVQSLGLVLAGKLPLGPNSPPTVTVLRVVDPVAAPRVYEPPQASRTIALPTEPIGQSLLADLDGVPPVEMVLAIAGEPTLIALGALQLGPGGGFEALLGTIEAAVPNGPESPRQVRALVFDRAFPASASLPGLQAVFVLHESEVDGSRERRISTRLVIPSTPELSLAAPDATTQPGYGIANLAVGDFHPTSIGSGGTVRDLAVIRLDASAQPDGVQVIENDGFGAITRVGDYVDVTGIVAASLAVLPASGTDADGLLFVDRTSRAGFWRHDPSASSPPPPPQAQAVDAWTGELRALLPAPMATAPLADATSLHVGDVDGDGVPDLVALLTFALPAPGEGQAAIALLRGKAAFGAGEYPFHAPNALTPVHGNASAVVLGDFTANGSGQPVRLELAAAIPAGTGGGIDGDHVRFFRYEPGATPADDRFVPAAVAPGPQVLLAGSNPERLAATDFDRDGLVDLMVACRGDGTLRLFRNTGAVDPAASAVVVADFVEALGSPWNLAAGVPTRLRLSDVNGDGNLDAVAFVEFTSAVTSQKSTSVAIYLSSGVGTFDGPRFVSPTRIGNRNGRLAGELGDFNRDGVPDLFVGWDSTVQPFNLRVLFGGTR